MPMKKNDSTDRIEDINYVVCLEADCGKELRALGNHVPVHDLDIGSYRIRHPDARTICAETSRQLREKIDTSLPLEVRARGREKIQEGRLNLTAGDEKSHTLMSKLAKARARRELAEGREKLTEEGYVPVVFLSQKTNIPPPTLYSAVAQGRVEGKKITGPGGRKLLGIKRESFEEALETGAMKKPLYPDF